MLVILINTPYSIAKMYGVKSAVSQHIYKPLGMGYLAASLEARGHTVVFVDGQALGLAITDILDILVQESPDLIGLPCFVLGRQPLYALVKAIRTTFPDLPIVLGGPQITLFAERVFAECAEVSMALRGEAEASFSELVTRMEEGHPIETVPGIVFRNKSGTLQYGPAPDVVMHLDTLPFPARHIYKPRLYNPMPVTISLPSMRADQVITSRGCDWGKCRFCYQDNANMPCYRRRSPENVIAEMRLLAREYEIEFIVFADDDFMRDERWVTRFCDLYDQEGFTLKWKAMGRVSGVTKTMLQRSAKSGCVHITYGLESGNQETLNLIHKGTTLAQSRNAVAWAHEAGLLVHAFVMFGLPRETPEMARKTIQFVIDLGIDYVTFSPYCLMEGTSLSVLALQEGSSTKHDNLNFHMASYVPEGYENVEQLNAMIRHAYQRFYLRPGYLLQALWSLRNPQLWPNLFSKLWMGLQIGFYMNK